MSERAFGMLGLVLLHPLDNCARTLIALGQPLEMPGEVLFDLPLGFGHKAKAQRIAGPRGKDANRKRTAIPQRVEQTSATTEFLDSRLSPGKVIRFLAGSAFEQTAQLRILRGECLRVVEGLRAHLADMVDAHQRGRLPALGSR